MTRSIRSAAFILIALATLGCQSFEQRFSAIESRQAALEAQLADLQSQQQTLIGRQAQLRQEIDNGLQPLRTQSADRGEDLRSMEREVTALEEQIAQLDSRIERITETLAAGGGVAPERGPVGTAMPPPRGGRGAVAPGADTTPTDSEATTLYNAALSDYTGGNYDLCIQSFQEYIGRYARSERADNAQYWIGQCHMAKGDNRAARQAYSELIRGYPNSEMVPDAMFLDAVILKGEGQAAAAAEGFRRLIQAYPTTDAAFLACRQLGELGEDVPAACEQLG